MPDAYTYVPKPNDPTYVTANGEGREQYDQGNITYDSSSTFYDGVNPAAYTYVSKPTSSVYTIVSKPTT